VSKKLQRKESSVQKDDGTEPARPSSDQRALVQQALLVENDVKRNPADQ
jgi:hypothetical protein